MSILAKSQLIYLFTLSIIDKKLFLVIISREVSTNHARTVMIFKFAEIIIFLQIYLIYTQHITVGISKKQKKAKKLLTFHLASKDYF